jgi:hypothetical protein
MEAIAQQLHLYYTYLLVMNFALLIFPFFKFSTFQLAAFQTDLARLILLSRSVLFAELPKEEKPKADDNAKKDK